MKPDSSAGATQPLDVFACPLEGTTMIEASAGTGKTWNICGLYLRLLLERELDVREILVVTFTQAATAELRERIRERLIDTLAFLRAPAGTAIAGDPFVARLVDHLRTRGQRSDAELGRLLAVALERFDEAAIFTIHSFCHRALADAPFTARMPLASEALHDDVDLLNAAASDFWRRHIAADTLEPALAAWLLARKDSPEGFANLLRRHQGKPIAIARWPDGIDSIALDTSALASAHASARSLWQGARDEIIGRVMDASPTLHGSYYKPPMIEDAALEWDTALRDEDPLAAIGEIPVMRVIAPKAGKASKLPRFASRMLAEKTSKAKPKAGKPAARPPEHPFFEAAQTLIDALSKSRPVLDLARLALLRRMLDEAGAALREAKRRARIVTFDDMLHNLYERLNATPDAADSGQLALASALRKRYPAALVDEFQDTDPQQFAIFSRIYAGTENPLFLVGDPKQAIYSFRNADLHTYLAARSTARREYTLLENQRSSEPLLGALNALFGANPAAFMLPGLDYRPVGFGSKPRVPLRLPPHDSGTPACAPLQVWLLPDGAEQGPLLQRQQARDAAAHATAAEIARLIEAGQRNEIGPGEAALRAGDIAVLVRSHAEGSIVREALAAIGVDSVEVSQAGIFESLDALDLERVLDAVLEPNRERLVRTALGTEAMGMRADAIDALSANEAELLTVMRRFGEWRDRWQRDGVGAMLRDWLAQARVTERMLMRPDGRRRLTNLLHLFEALHRAATLHPSPPALMRWLRAQRASARADDETQLRLESDSNLVQIVTIHKSKGLEYPIVFCPFLWSSAARAPGSRNEGVEYHDEHGRSVIDWRKGFPGEYDQPVIDARRRLEDAAETMRLIYVALTRAVHRCVIVGGGYLSGSAKSPSNREGRRSLLHWMIAGAGDTPESWFDHDHPLEQITDSWKAFAKAAGSAVALAPLPARRTTPVALERLAPESLASLDPPAFIAPGWRIGSYSALAWGASHESAAIDHDARVGRGPPGEPLSQPLDEPLVQSLVQPLVLPIAEDDVLNFARGAAAGDCVHEVFERIDFTSPAGWPQAAATALQKFLPGGNVLLQTRQLTRMLADVLATPLPVGTETPLVLGRLPASRRLVELEFHLPSAGLDAGALNEALERLGYPVPRLAFGRLDGFLKGFIDLVLEHEGRYFIVDWKSNHLGNRLEDYDAAPVADTMRRHAYHLQYLLYSVALERWLRRRIAGYRFADHFGGVLYLFVRGVRPGWQAANGGAAGSFFHRPQAQTIEALSRLLDRREQATR